MSELPFSERVNAIAINPEMASLKDIMQLAADWTDLKIENARLLEQLRLNMIDWSNCETENSNLLSEIQKRDEALGEAREYVNHNPFCNKKVNLTNSFSSSECDCGVLKAIQKIDSLLGEGGDKA